MNTSKVGYLLVIFGLFISYCLGAAPKTENLRVSEVWPLHAKPQSIVIQGEGLSELQVGDLLQSFRPNGYISTGEFKVLEINPPHIKASVLANGSQESMDLLPDYPGVMIGDSLRPKPVPVVETFQIAPEVSFSFYDLFKDPKSKPQTMELTEEGKIILKEKLKPFFNKRFPMLMIKSYTDDEGLASENQTETQERSRSVKEFIVEVLGFDSKRVVAVGLGETDLADKSKRPGFNERNRRIIFKAIDPDSQEEPKTYN